MSQMWQKLDITEAAYPLLFLLSPHIRTFYKKLKICARGALLFFMKVFRYTKLQYFMKSHTSTTPIYVSMPTYFATADITSHLFNCAQWSEYN